jgi:hypothetical protein
MRLEERQLTRSTPFLENRSLFVNGPSISSREVARALRGTVALIGLE